MSELQPANFAHKRKNHALRARFDRHHSLESAWDVLFPEGGSAGAEHVYQVAGRLKQELREMAKQGISASQPRELERFDSLIEAFEHEMRGIAYELAAQRLRSSFPEQVERDRQGVLALLDLMLGEELAAAGSSGARVLVIDAMITLLCTGPGGAATEEVADPVSLTPRLFAICERAATLDDGGAAAVAAEFYSFATSEQDSSDAMPARKVSLGATYFVPDVLRAILTANHAQLRRSGSSFVEQMDRTGDSLGAATAGEGSSSDQPQSVFEHTALPRLGAALMRREAGEAQTNTDVDRVAWCLDLKGVSVTERVALLSETLGSRDEIPGTVVIVGLLLRSAVILEEELEAMGIAPEDLSKHWVRELDGAIKRETTERLAAGADYAEAVALSELSSKFLSPRGAAPALQREAQKHETPRYTRSDEADPKREARELAQAAVAASETRVVYDDRSSRPSRRRVQIAQGVCLAMLLSVGAVLALPSGDRTEVSRSVIQEISPFLAGGERTGAGTGTAFIGTVKPVWERLTADEQQLAGEAIAAALRDQGIREIMIYDAHGRVRVQAFGDSIPRVIPLE